MIEKNEDERGGTQRSSANPGRILALDATKPGSAASASYHHYVVPLGCGTYHHLLAIHITERENSV